MLFIYIYIYKQDTNISHAPIIIIINVINLFCIILLVVFFHCMEVYGGYVPVYTPVLHLIWILGLNLFERMT